jgi:hypothetical protein
MEYELCNIGLLFLDGNSIDHEKYNTTKICDAIKDNRYSF